ncbi:protein NinF [Pantoea sp. SGAir0180]
MTAAADATPSSPQRISITTALTANPASAISNGRTMSDTTQSSQPTGAGEQSATACAFCGTALADSQVYCCTACEVTLMLDPNYLLSGEDNG